MKYTLLALILAVITMSVGACSEPRRTPDGHLMDNPTPSAYAPSDFEAPSEE